MRIKNIFCIIVIITFLLAVSMVEGKKKKKYADDKRPMDIEPELYCNSCQAIVREALKKLKTSNKDYDVSTALDHICIDRNLSIYEFPPPDMIKGCNAFIMGWDSVLEDMLTKRTNNEDIEDQICVRRTRACLGVTPKTHKGTEFVTINNREVPVGPDGKIDMTGQDL